MSGDRFIIDPPLPGAWNMAVDEALLLDAVESNVATLRFYQWDKPTLSLGYFQHYDDRRQHAASTGCACVRRQTGGGAILHDRELTYSVILPICHPLSRDAETLYARVHDTFIATLMRLIATFGISSPPTLQRRQHDSGIDSADEPFLCFQRRARGDVVAAKMSRDAQASTTTAAMAADVKILGSAQRRYRGAVLQHGSLLLERSAVAPELAGLGDLVGQTLWPELVVETVRDALIHELTIAATDHKLPPKVESNAARIANEKYGAATWTKRR